MRECEYTAAQETCAGGCEAATGRCRGAAPDAGLEPDASAPDAAPVDPCHDAGTADSGLGAPRVLFETPGEHVFVVPAGVGEVRARLWGGGGQGGNQAGATGGGGAFAEARVPVTPGETLEVRVAEGGGRSGGFGHGGGASYLRRGALDLLVAGGGGGGGSDGNSGNSMAGGRGGAGGLTGEAGGDGIGTIAPYCTRVTGGQGGSPAGGGQGGTSQGSATTRCPGQPGARDVGGRATGVNGNCDTGPGAQTWRAGGGQANGGGGGGGAGYFGGGGAGFIWTYCSGGGGGGSSHAAPSLLEVRHEAGGGAVQGRAAESAGAGRGGDRCLQASGAPPCTCNLGGNGRVELRF
jgi:hypothetical protein